MSSNPLIENRIPGGKFQLPSLGVFYENGEFSPEVQNGEVLVYPMTAFDEIIIKTPDLLLDGTAIERVIRRCVPQIEKPLQLLSKDLDFLLICIRSVSFGQEVSLRHTHNCKDAKEHEYTISIGDFVQKTKSIDATNINAEYRCNIDNKIIYLSPIRYQTMMEILNIDPDSFRSMSADQVAISMFEHSTRQLAQLINKIVIPAGGMVISDVIVTDQIQIQEWIKSCSPKQIKILNDTIEKASTWGPELKYELVCKDCNDRMEIEVPLNPIHFFM